MTGFKQLNENTNQAAIRIYLGGSFDPPHIGHIAMLQHVYKLINTTLHSTRHDTNLSNLKTFIKPQGSTLTSVVANFLPTSRSPFKSDSTGAEHRLAMLQLICRELNISYATGSIADRSIADSDSLTSHKLTVPFGVCEHEIWQPPPTYTIDTLMWLRYQYPTDNLIFILGADNVLNLNKWRAYDKILAFTNLWIMPRNDLQTFESIKQLLPENMALKVTSNLNTVINATNDYVYLDSQEMPSISSSEIRNAAINCDQKYLLSALPLPVYSYIMNHNLYLKL